MFGLVSIACGFALAITVSKQKFSDTLRHPLQLLLTKMFVFIDIGGTLPQSNNHKYLLTCIDRFTRKPEAIVIPDITAKTITSAFVTRWTFTFGIPSTVTTDRGSKFEPHIFNLVNALLGSKWTCTTACHPCAKGLVECFHRQWGEGCSEILIDGYGPICIRNRHWNSNSFVLAVDPTI